MKNQAGIGRLFVFAGERKGLLILSGLLSAVSAAFMLVPYASVYFILAELLRNARDLSLEIFGDIQQFLLTIMRFLQHATVARLSPTIVVPWSSASRHAAWCSVYERVS